MASIASTANSSHAKPHVVIIGAGWAGFYLCEHLSPSLYECTVIAPRRTSAFTPLLASAAVGLFNFHLAEEPIRSKRRPNVNYLKAKVVDVDFTNKLCRCRPAFDDDPTFDIQEFDLPYDILIIAPGCEPNTFNTPGVADYAIFMKNVSDAMLLRKRLFDLLEEASLPNTPPEKAKQLLHIAIVGGGPTGIELTAELDDLCKNEIKDLYPKVATYLNISIFDVADKILGAYDRTLYEYANQQLAQRNVKIRTKTQIKEVDDSNIYLNDQAPIPYGMLTWATGNKNVPLVDKLQVLKSTTGLHRIETDPTLRVYKATGGDEVFGNVFALGDAADIRTQSLPTTAEVALQKAKYLVNLLNGPPNSRSESFVPQSKGLVSYLGSHDGIIMGTPSHPKGWTGKRAWVAWRAGTVWWTRSWRNRIGIVLTWMLNSVFGKEIARI